MYGEKIANLNHAVRNMIKAFSSADTHETEILVSIITFGPVTEYLPFTQASAISWKDLDITGGTPIGATLKKAKEIIEDKNIVPSRAYRPTVVLVSDGNPTDSWKKALQTFVEVENNHSIKSVLNLIQFYKNGVKNTFFFVNRVSKMLDNVFFVAIL